MQAEAWDVVALIYKIKARAIELMIFDSIPIHVTIKKRHTMNKNMAEIIAVIAMIGFLSFSCLPNIAKKVNTVTNRNNGKPCIQTMILISNR